jgi:hypothetical protein
VTTEEKLARLARLEAAIRRHRDARGNDRCWQNDIELYKELGEALPDGPELPPREEFLQNCVGFYECQARHSGTT